MTEKALPRSLGIGVDAESLGVTNAIRDPAEYIGRTGYLPDFVDGADIALPAFQDGYGDVAVVDCPDRPGEIVYDLRYTHFSVVMCKSRRMPFFSCVNLDGTQEKRGMGDGTWRKDPRVDANIQMIVDGIYGGSREGLFSRGHMTRREDPNWGAPTVAKKANEDTFHVTNACPQVQGFNAPIWLPVRLLI